jgi:DNA polymerase III epsilon subunit-like protein
MFDDSGDGYIPACWWYPLDTYQRAIWHFAERGLAAPENYRLPTLAAHFGLDPEGAHDALTDVRLSAGIAQAIAGWEPPG